MSPVHPQQSSEPRKAYLVRWSIANDMEAIVYADSAADALRRFDGGEIAQQENTGHDWRCRRPRVKRWREEDRDADEMTGNEPPPAYRPEVDAEVDAILDASSRNLPPHEGESNA